MQPAFIHWPRWSRECSSGYSSQNSWVLAIALFLAGCATIPQPATPPDNAVYQRHQASLAGINQFSLNGRIGVQNEGRGFSGSTRWQHNNTSDNIGLFSPMGGQVATIKTTDDGVVLIDSDGKTYTAKDAETLTQDTLGWSLPMRGLPDWVLGRPVKGSGNSNAQWDSSGRLTKLKQDGWEIEYPEYRETGGYQLPARLTLRSPKLYLKLVIEHWNLKQGVIGQGNIEQWDIPQPEIAGESRNSQ